MPQKHALALTEAAAAALYVENWELARSATDYLAAHDAPSPVQHYWSLSVEEQFYLAWPLLIGLLALASRRLGVDRAKDIAQDRLMCVDWLAVDRKNPEVHQAFARGLPVP